MASGKIRAYFKIIFLIIIFSNNIACNQLSKWTIQSPNYKKSNLQPNNSTLKKAKQFSMVSVLDVKIESPKATIKVYSLKPPKKKVIGTCFLLHGFKKNSKGMLKFAKPLIEAGIQTILVDSRGCGSSTGDKLSFGSYESTDLSKILNEFENKNEIKGPVMVMGISYGAATALLFGNQDSRVKYIIAIASFSSLRTISKRYIKSFVPFYGWFLSDKKINLFVDKLGKNGDFNPDKIDLIETVKGSKTKSLLIHGKKDYLIPWHHSQKIQKSNPEMIKTKYFSNYGHNSIYKDRKNEIRNYVTQQLVAEINLINKKK